MDKFVDASSILGFNYLVGRVSRRSGPYTKIDEPAKTKNNTRISIVIVVSCTCNIFPSFRAFTSSTNFKIKSTGEINNHAPAGMRQIAFKIRNMRPKMGVILRRISYGIKGIIDRIVRINTPLFFFRYAMKRTCTYDLREN
jgi:hypothetical protein